jgi:hypothetical protein
MTQDDQILEELKKLNQNLDRLNSRNNPAKNILNNFSAGILHSFGSIVGSIVILLAFIYFASRLNLTQMIARSFEQMMSQVSWSKIIPQPKIQLDPSIF